MISILASLFWNTLYIYPYYLNAYFDIYQPIGWPKNGTYALTLLNINRFSKLFHYQNQEKICNNMSLKIPPNLTCVATLPCEMSCVFKARTENKTTSEVKRPTLMSQKILYKQTKLSKNTDQMPVTSVMTSLDTGRRISK